MKEFELISFIRRKFKGQSKNKSLYLPIGDDCSIIKPPKGKLQVTTADSLVDGNHFSSKYFTPREIGQKVIKVNISDIASMGADGPYYAWLTFALPKKIKAPLIKGVIGGIMAACAKYGVTLAGGNITSAKEFSIHLTLTGWVKKGEAMLRGGAKQGDSIFVTGTVGASTSAYRQFKAGKKPEPFLLKRWANPNPKPEVGIYLAKNRIASSCIDISDGIFQDLKHLVKESKAGAVLEWEKIPIEPELKKRNPTPNMIGYGEDYELLFTVPQKEIEKLKRFQRQISEIGKIVKSGFKVVDKNGREVDVGRTGYSHLA